MTQAPAPEVRVRVPLFVKLASMACVLAIVPVVAVGMLMVDEATRAVEVLNRSNQILALDDVARTVEDEIAHAEDDLAMAGALFADPTLDDTSRLAFLRAQIEGHASIDHVALYDASGAQLAVMQEEDLESVAVPPALDAPTRDALEAHHVFEGELTQGAHSVRLLLAVRIRVGDRTTGYVASAVPLIRVQERVERLTHAHFGDRHDAVFVVDRSFRLIASSNLEESLAREERHDGVLEGMPAEMIGPALSLSGNFVDAEGVPMVASATGIPGRQWAIVAQVPQAVAYAAITDMERIMLLMIFGTICLALVFGLGMAGMIVRPLRALTAYATALADRRFSERVTVKTTDELAVLGGALNRAAGDLAESEVRIRHEVAVRTDLGRYVPEQLVDRIVRREADMKLGGERRAITVMFADVVGFTPLAERLPAEQVVTILNELFTILTEIVFKHGGTVDKFVGDCVMAFWNAPGDQADHVRRALEAAEDMQSWLENGNERWKTKYGVTIQLAIGVHTGDAIVGNIGSEKRMEYTAIGNVVNLASRLEAIARPAQILVTDAVRNAAGDQFETVDADLHRLTGWAEPVRLWELRP